MDRQAHWQGVYENKAETEVSWYQDRPSASLALIRDTGLGSDARLIDVGGGASRLVDHLLDDGWTRITILDIAAAALERARNRLGERGAQVEWQVADVTNWTPPARFDLWHDRAVFHFLTDPADRVAYAAAMAAAVPKGGQAIVGTFALDGPERCSGLLIRRYDADGLAAEFSRHFEPVAAMAEDHLTPAGKVQRFQFCRLRRR
ncbi:MAG: class I SAM-dependent methyltransferase [Phaeospirillum sp.]|nr:class I SAM-dependent methyltransferase [Phaeospirillum sp.]